MSSSGSWKRELAIPLERGGMQNGGGAAVVGEY